MAWGLALPGDGSCSVAAVDDGENRPWDRGVGAVRPVCLTEFDRMAGKRAVVVVGSASRQMMGSRKRVEIGGGVVAAGLEEVGVVTAEVRKCRKMVAAVVFVLAAVLRKGHSLVVAVWEGNCVGDRRGCRRIRWLVLAEGLPLQEDTPCFGVSLRQVLFAAVSTDRQILALVTYAAAWTSVTVAEREPCRMAQDRSEVDMTAQMELGNRSAESLVAVAGLAEGIRLHKVDFAEAYFLVVHSRRMAGHSWTVVGEPLRLQVGFRNRGAP